jgi:transposase
MTRVNTLNLSSQQALQLRSELTTTGDLRVYRRAAALLALHEGLSPRQAANLLGISRQTIYNWIGAYARAEGSLDLADSPRSGRPSLWTRELRGFIHETITLSPGQFGYPSHHWTAGILQAHLASVRNTRISKEGLRRYLRTVGYRRKTGRSVPLNERGMENAGHDVITTCQSLP